MSGTPSSFSRTITYAYDHRKPNGRNDMDHKAMSRKGQVIFRISSHFLIMRMAAFFLAIQFVAFSRALGIDLASNGGWSETIDSSDLVGGAGSNLNDTYESAANSTVLDISYTGGDNDNWRVDVRRTDTYWSGSFGFFVKRTSDGTGTGSITGGQSYMEVTTIDTPLFSGAGDRSSINIRYKLTGMSIDIAPSNYSTTLTFTVVDVP